MPLNEEIGHILPETVGSTESLFKQTLPMSGELENKSLADSQKQQTQIQDSGAQTHSNDQTLSLNINCHGLDAGPQSLDMGKMNTNNIMSNQDGTLNTSFQNDSFLDNAEQVKTVPDNSVRVSSVLGPSFTEHSVTDSSPSVPWNHQLQDISEIDVVASEAAICTKNID